ncbi:MAG: exodeoxyribonuclease VII small subunit [Phycisphaerales bacterium]|nr:exodeoxyribonuclease VII small subunit [Phycisphaerales bacterium]
MPKDPMPAPPTPQEPERFEDALDEIEAIIEKIESGEYGLEESIAAYERGSALLKKSREILDKAEQRVTEINASLLNRADASDQEAGKAPRTTDAEDA